MHEITEPAVDIKGFWRHAVVMMLFAFAAATVVVVPPSGPAGAQIDDAEELDDRSTYRPEDTASGRCGGGHVAETDSVGNRICRLLGEDDLRDDEGNDRVQCRQREGATHTATFLVLASEGCPPGSVGPDTSPDDQARFWQDVWDARCAVQGAGSWDKTLNGGTGGCTGATDSDGNNLRPCFDGDSWILVGPDTLGCGASQCPVPGDLGNFIAGTNGMWDEETQTCGGGIQESTVDTELCHDNIYRPAGTCPTPPPSYVPPTTEPRPANLLACRSGPTVRLSWSAVTVSDPQTGYALDGWQVAWEVQGSSSTTTDGLAATARTYERVLSTSNAWTITLAPVLESGSAGTRTASVDIPAGDPASGQCPVLTVDVGADAAVDEGQDAVLDVTLSRGWPTGPSLCVEITWRTLARSAASPVDYARVSGDTFQFPAGAMADGVGSVTLQLPPIATHMDGITEGDEQFAVEIQAVQLCPGETGAMPEIDRDEATVTIRDTPAPRQVSILPTLLTVTEGNPGDGTVAQVVISHDGIAGDVASVVWQLRAHSATAGAGNDYIDLVPPAGVRLSFPPGATTITADVDIVEDTVCEATESFEIKIRNPLPSAAATVSVDTAVVTIIDDDCVTPPLSACEEQQPTGVHSEGTPIGTHPRRGSCPVPYSWSTWLGARVAGRGSPPPRGACVGAFAGHDAWNVVAGQAYTLDIFANDRRGGATARVVIAPQEGSVPSSALVSIGGSGLTYSSAAWAHGTDELVYQLRYGTGSNDFCNARMQITVLDTGPVTLGTGVVHLFPEQGGFEAANWTPSVQRHNDDGPGINPHEVQTTHQLWTETRWTCRRSSNVTVGDPDYNGHTIPSGTPFFGGQTRFTGSFSVTYYEGWGTQSGRRQTTDFNWQEPTSYSHSHASSAQHGESHAGVILPGSHSHSSTYTAWANIINVNAVQNAPTSRPGSFSDSTTSDSGPYPCPTVNHNGSSVGGSYVGIAWNPINATTTPVGTAGVRDPGDDLTEVYAGATHTVEPVPVEFKHYSALRWMDPASLTVFWHTWESVTFPVDDHLPGPANSWVRDADGDVDGATVVLDTTSVRYFDPTRDWIERTPANWPYLVCDARAVAIRANSTGCHYSTGYIVGSDRLEKLDGMFSGQMIPNEEIQQSAWDQTDLTTPLGTERNPLDYRFYERFSPTQRNQITGSAECHGRTETPPVPTPEPDNLGQPKHAHPSDHPSGSSIPLTISEPAHVPSMDSFRVRDEHEWQRRLYGTDATRIHDHFHGLNPGTFRTWHCDPFNGVPEIPESPDWDEEWRWSYNQYNRTDNVLDEFHRRPIRQHTRPWSPYHTSLHWITAPGGDPSNGGSVPLFEFNYVICDSRYSAWKTAGYPSGFIPWNTSESSATPMHRLLQNNITNYCTLLPVEIHYTNNAATNGLLQCRNSFGLVGSRCDNAGNVISAS